MSKTLRETVMKDIFKDYTILLYGIYDEVLKKNIEVIALEFIYKNVSYPMIINIYERIFNIKNFLSVNIPEIKNRYISFLCKGIVLNDLEKTLNDYGIIKGDQIIIYDKDEKDNLNNMQSRRKEDYILVHFISQDQLINFAIRGNKFDAFYKLENELYNKFSNYRDKNCFFLGNGIKIESQKTLEENGIENGDKLVLCYPWNRGNKNQV